MQEQGYYYYEYATPDITTKRNGSKIDPSNYNIQMKGRVFESNEHHANKMIKRKIEEAFPAYKNYDFGYMMFTRLGDSDMSKKELNKKEEMARFSDEDWKERLSRGLSGETITISKEELEDMGYDFDNL